MTLIEATKENEKTRILFAVVRKKIWCKKELKQNLSFSVQAFIFFLYFSKQGLSLFLYKEQCNVAEIQNSISK